MKHEPIERDPYQEGYSAGWAANNEYRRDHRELMMDVNWGGVLMCGVMLTVFGGLFLAADLMNWFRWGHVDFWLWVFAIVPLTGAFFCFRDVPRARARAKAAQEKFDAKWPKRT